MKKTELASKINQIKTEVDTAKTAIENAYNTIKAGISNVELATAKNAISTIEANMDKVPQKVLDSILGTDQARLNLVKSEISDYEALSTQALAISDTGKVTVAQVVATYKLMKKASSGGLDSQIEEVSNNDKKSELDFLKIMRKNGVGQYYVKQTKEFTCLKNLEKQSADKEVKLLKMEWKGTSAYPPAYNYENNNFTADTSVTRSTTIRLVKKENKWFLEWDEVPNATSYCIIGGIAVGTQEGTLGSYNLKATENNCTNLENEFEGEELTVAGTHLYENKNTDKRTVVAVNLKTNSIALEKFVPVKGAAVGEDFWNTLTTGVSLDAWIIPRNQNSLYVSNMKDYLPTMSTDTTISGNKFFIGGDKFNLGAFKQMLYGN